ncbi:hypothetical protein G7Y89_g7567 [Cudoniella acicularis]|uniref:Uncharacterized protein n=1 Tax=Cudoniella acicularis TaxID=354080 RepID=A0A8H4RJ29_9HELO|nr:hypothetical protein G7Y89_g7567 [Cudoniella acicularis]
MEWASGDFQQLENPIDDPENQLEQVTPQGVIDSRKVGKHLLSRYPKLVPTMKRIYADKKSRTQDTAKAFMQAFPQDIEIVEMDVDNKTSFHSQVLHKACDAFSKKPGNKEQAAFISVYTPAIIARLQGHSPVELEENDIVGLQQLCSYESVITRTTSDICDIFTDSK